MAAADAVEKAETVAVLVFRKREIGARVGLRLLWCGLLLRGQAICVRCRLENIHVLSIVGRPEKTLKTAAKGLYERRRKLPDMRRLLGFLMLLSLSWPVGAQSYSSFDRLLEEEWELMLESSPLAATYLGADVGQDRWPDLSAEFSHRRQRHLVDLLARLDAYDTAGWSGIQKENLQLFKRLVGNLVRRHELGLEAFDTTHRDGIQTVAGMTESIPFDSRDDYENWLKRLESFDSYMDQTIAVLRKGLKKGLVQPRVIVDRLPRQIEAQLVAAEKHPMFAPFKKLEADDPLRVRAVKALDETVIPAYRKLLAFIKEEYAPGSPAEVGVGQRPGGREIYRFLIQKYTTTDMTADEIHQLGLREVARIRAEMEKIKTEVGFQGDLKAFFAHLRSDPSFRYQEAEPLLKHYRAFCKEVDGKMPFFFGRLSRIPYGVRPIPEYVAPDTTTAYYLPPAKGQPGFYYVNLYRPESRPIYEIEVLSLHEAVPGHHHQIALAAELEGLPKFRRYYEGFGSFTVFVEGWALYCESLGEEMGFYQDPYSKFGQLTYEMWRAVRLVVDTGMHAKGWTRQQAIDFFLDNTAKTKLDIVNEVDRYISWPGQALAYKIGELKIKELRKLSEEKLGDRFDLRAFHDKVLEGGAVPLDVLERRVNDWLIEVGAAQ